MTLIHFLSYKQKKALLKMSNTEEHSWKPITFTTAQGKQKQDNMNKSTIAFFNSRGSYNIGHKHKIQSA